MRVNAHKHFLLFTSSENFRPCNDCLHEDDCMPCCLVYEHYPLSNRAMVPSPIITFLGASRTH